MALQLLYTSTNRAILLAFKQIRLRQCIPTVSFSVSFVSAKVTDYVNDKKPHTLEEEEENNDDQYPENHDTPKRNKTK